MPVSPDGLAGIVLVIGGILLLLLPLLPLLFLLP